MNTPFGSPPNVGTPNTGTTTGTSTPNSRGRSLGDNSLISRERGESSSSNKNNHGIVEENCERRPLLRKTSQDDDS